MKHNSHGREKLILLPKIAYRFTYVIECISFISYSHYKTNQLVNSSIQCFRAIYSFIVHHGPSLITVATYQIAVSGYPKQTTPKHHCLSYSHWSHSYTHREHCEACSFSEQYKGPSWEVQRGEGKINTEITPPPDAQLRVSCTWTSLL